jgi:hypothetical protein
VDYKKMVLFLAVSIFVTGLLYAGPKANERPSECDPSKEIWNEAKSVLMVPVLAVPAVVAGDR